MRIDGVRMLLVAALTMGCGSDKTSGWSDSGANLEKGKAYVVLRPPVPSDAAKLERLQRQDAEIRVMIGEPPVGQKFLGFLAVLGVGLLASISGPTGYSPPLDIDVPIPGEPEPEEPAVYPDDVEGTWSGFLDVTRADCGPEYVGGLRSFLLKIQEKDGYFFILDQDGFTYSGLITGSLPFEGIWTGTDGSTSSFIIRNFTNDALDLLVTDTFVVNGESCTQEYQGVIKVHLDFII